MDLHLARDRCHDVGDLKCVHCLMNIGVHLPDKENVEVGYINL